MPRLRLGVALLLREPWATEVEGLRRALGDGALGRIAPHLTLVPPVNVNVDDLPAALSVLRSAACATEPFTLELGPVASFAPDSPTVMLAVGGTNVDKLQALRDAVFTPPLERTLTWPFVPHVTLADEASSERIEAALSALGDYRAEVDFDRVYLLQEGAGRLWTPIADAEFHRPQVLGRGTMPFELHLSTIVDPNTSELLLEGERDHTDVVLTARTSDEVLAVATGTLVGDTARLTHLVVAEERQRSGIGAQMLKAFCSEAAFRGATTVVVVCRNETSETFLARQGFIDGRRHL